MLLFTSKPLLLKLNCRRFHVASKIYLRKIAPKTSSTDVDNLPPSNYPDFTPDIPSSNIDYLGIESEDSVITLKPQKHSHLQHIQTSTRKVRERFFNASFGVVRYDAENRLKFHGQYGKRLDFTFPHNNSDEAEVCKGLSFSNRRTVHSQSMNSSKSFPNIDIIPNNKERYNPEVSEKSEQSVNYIDDYYFNQSKMSDSANNDKELDSGEVNYIEESYFGSLSASKTLSKNLESSKRSMTQSFVSEGIDEYTLSKNNGIGTDANELNFFDKSYFENEPMSENLKFLKKESITNTYSNKDTSHHNNVQLKSSSMDDINIDIKTVGSTDRIESEIIFNKNVNTSMDEDGNIMVKNNYKEPKKKMDISKLNEEKNMSDFESNTLNSSKFTEFYKLKYPTSSNKINKNLETITKPSNSQKFDSSDELITKPSEFSFKENKFKFSTLVSEESNHDDEVSTAHDFVKKLRIEAEIQKPNQNINKRKSLDGEKYDSKGFRILKNQVKDLTYFTRGEILSILKENIVYSDDDLCVLNKPYNLVIHESETTKSPCLSSFLDELAKELDRKATNPQLFTVHRLDKETTGCLLLARNERMAMNLKCLFAERKIIKKYWIVTSGIPDPLEGVIDIPISEGSVNNKKRMVLHPNLPKDIEYRNHSKKGKSAVTSYKVLSESGNAALIEATPITGLKHQIRVHFGFGLGCPILGDHKYSHIDKLVPQRLPSDMLQKLNVRQSKVRHIPMHIHAKSVCIPDYFQQRDLFVNIPLPEHMKINMKRLKFRKR